MGGWEGAGLYVRRGKWGVAMLGDVKIENFRSLRSVSVPLRPLTILIGPNDSGKSAFLAALQYLVNEITFQSWDRWQHDDQVKVSLAGTTAQGIGRFASPGGIVDPAVLAALRPLGFFHLQSHGIPIESQRY